MSDDKIKIYLDDVREAPKGWLLVKNAEHAIWWLKFEGVGEISLDHDLGEGQLTGYDVVKWIEKEVYTNDFVPPIIHIHSSNPVGRKNIKACIKSISKVIAKRIKNSIK